MKLNSKLGICKPKEVEPVRQDPALENKITALLDLLSKPLAPGYEFVLDIRRDSSGLIKEVKAVHPITGKAYYNFEVRRDNTGFVRDITATPY